MKPERDSVDDLLILARRGDLPSADRQRLREALSDPELRLMYEAGCAFDREAPVLADDDERIEAIERQVQRRLRENAAAGPRQGIGRNEKPHRVRRMVQLAFAAILVAGAGLAAVEVVRAPRPAPAERLPSSPVPVPVPAESVPGKASVPVVMAPAAPPAEATPSTVAAAPEPSPIGKRAPRASESARPTGGVPDDGFDEALAQPEAPAPAPQAVSAHDLFAAGNAARVRGDVAQAVNLLRTLEDRFPASSEAKTALLTLGLLHLQTGQADAALQDFRRYKALGAGATMPEALWGESQALRALGRTAEERAVLGDLLRDFPHSAYAGAAAKRLAEVP